MSEYAPLLRGRRVTLRPYALGFTPEEVERFRKWAGDAEVLALAGGTPVDLPAERFHQLFLGRADRRNGPREQQFAILDETGDLIGRTGLFSREPPGLSSELGIMIGERDRWGQGYGRDAIGTLAAYAFDALAVRRIFLFTYPHNERAQRAFAAVGFRMTRKLRRFSLDRGVHTEIEMVLTPERLRLARTSRADGRQVQGADGRHDAVAADRRPPSDQPDVRR